MFLYLIERTTVTDYDETVSVVVAADTPNQARKIARTASGLQSSDNWIPASAKLTNIGTARKGVKAGIVHLNFHAG